MMSKRSRVGVRPVSETAVGPAFVGLAARSPSPRRATFKGVGPPGAEPYLALAAASSFNASSDGPCSKFQVTRPPIGRRAEPGNTLSGIVRNMPA
jgi:hypothetical protein